MIDDEWIGSADRTARRVLRLRPEGATASPILRGLAANPAAPAEVILRLLRPPVEAVLGALGRRAALPAPVLDAMLRHPDARVRGALAGNRHLDPRLRLRLAADPDPGVVRRLRADPSLPLPDHVLRPELDRLNGQFERGLMTLPELAGEVSNRIALDRRVLAAATRHPEPRIRLVAIDGPPSRLRDGAVLRLLRTLSGDESPQVRAAADAALASRDRVLEPFDLTRDGYEVRWLLRHGRLSSALVERVVAGGRADELAPLAANPTTPSGVVAPLFDHPEPDVRRSLAEREDLTATQLARLAADPDVFVRAAVSVHPALSEERRATIDLDGATALAEGFGYVETAGSPAVPSHPVEQSVTWARSVNPLLRRRAAGDHRLPADLVPALADDADPGVRVLLAHHHPAAPPRLLLRVFREGPAAHRGRLPWLPNFPTAGLAEHAADPDPAVRGLAALDPLAPPDLIDRLTRDPDSAVRRAAARCPRLPVDRIIELLDHAELAEPAAANPALPVTRMADLVQSR